MSMLLSLLWFGCSYDRNFIPNISLAPTKSRGKQVAELNLDESREIIERYKGRHLSTSVESETNIESDSEDETGKDCFFLLLLLTMTAALDL